MLKASSLLPQSLFTTSISNQSYKGHHASVIKGTSPCLKSFKYYSRCAMMRMLENIYHETKLFFTISGSAFWKPVAWVSREVHAESLQSCPTLCDTMDCSPLGFSGPEILQARILEWVAISFSRGSSRPRDRTRVSCVGRWVLYH